MEDKELTGWRHKISDEPRVVDSGTLRFVVSGEYVAFGVKDAPVYDTEGPLTDRTVNGCDKSADDVTPLSKDEWSPWVRLLPAWVEFTFRGQTDPDLHCKIELREDVPRVVEFGWRASESQQEIRQKHLRAITVENVADLVYSPWVIELRDVTRDSIGEAIVMKFDSAHERKVRGVLQDMRAWRRNINSDLLRQVAEVYRANFDTAPTEAVARTFGVKSRMAQQYVKLARENRFLPPTTPGKKRI